jgi:catechol 2,3-dioxygenase-like lactoylglutathione lyase family enzyme
VIETEGLTHLHLYVRDLERSLRFYQDVFGLIELFRDGEHMVFLRPPNSTDTITLNERPDFDGERGGIEHFGFRLKDASALDDAIRQVTQAGGRLLERGEHAPGATYAYIEDPDGHMIEL